MQKSVNTNNVCLNLCRETDNGNTCFTSAADDQVTCDQAVFADSPAAGVVAEAVAVGSLLAMNLKLEPLLLFLLRDVQRVLVLPVIRRQLRTKCAVRAERAN